MSVFRAISARVEVSPSAPETASDRVRVGKELFLPRGSPSLAVTRSSFPSSKCGSKPNPPPLLFSFTLIPSQKEKGKQFQSEATPTRAVSLSLSIQRRGECRLPDEDGVPSASVGAIARGSAWCRRLLVSRGASSGLARLFEPAGPAPLGSGAVYEADGGCGSGACEDGGGGGCVCGPRGGDGVSNGRGGVGAWWYCRGCSDGEGIPLPVAVRW